MDQMDINQFYQGWDITLRKKNTVESERYLDSSLAMAKTIGDKAGEIAVYNEMGGFYRAIGRLDQAKEVYQQVLSSLEAIGQKNTENYGAALINWGNVLISAGQMDEALRIFIDAQGLLERLNLGQDYRMAALCNNITAIYRETGQIDLAEKAAYKSLDIISKIPEAYVEFATSNLNLGEVLLKKGDLAGARASLNKAMSIYQEKTAGQDTHLAYAKAAMGALEYVEGNYRAAESEYLSAMALIERDFGQTPYYQMISRNLSTVREKL